MDIAIQGVLWDLRVWGVQLSQGVWGTKVPSPTPVGSRGGSPMGGLGAKTPQMLKYDVAFIPLKNHLANTILSCFIVHLR